MSDRGFVTTVAAAWRAPRRSARAEVDDPPAEPALLARAFVIAILSFVVTLPQAVAETGGNETAAVLSGRLFGALFVFPLFVYLVSAISFAVMRLAGGGARPGQHRAALVWALIAALPVSLAAAAVKLLLPLGMATSLLDLAALAVFLWFWSISLAALGRIGPDARMSP